MKMILVIALLIFPFQPINAWWFSKPNTNLEEKIVERKELLEKLGSTAIEIPVNGLRTIKAAYVHRNDAPWCGIVFHGFGESKEIYQPLVELFPDASLLLVDLKHHGSNQGLTLKDFDAVVQEITASCAWLQKQSCKKRIGFGFSLGGITLIDAASQCHLDGIVLDGVASSLKKAAREFGWYFKSPLLWSMSWLLPHGNIVESIQTIKTPLLIMHALHDPVIPNYHAYTLHNAAKNSKLYLYPCNAHCRGHRLISENWKSEVEEFINKI